MDASVCSLRRKLNLLKLVFVEDKNSWVRGSHAKVEPLQILMIPQYTSQFYQCGNLKSELKQRSGDLT